MATPGINNRVIILEAKDTLVVENEQTAILLMGALGPVGQTGIQGVAGLSAEEFDVYSKRVDFITDDELYKGEAAVGSLESAAVWRIRKITLAVDGDVSEVWASGTAEFDKIWANRASLSYS